MPPALIFSWFLGTKVPMLHHMLWSVPDSPPEPLEPVGRGAVLLKGAGQSGGYQDKVKLDPCLSMSQDKFQKDQTYMLKKKS